MKKSRSEKILDAARELFLEKGYHPTSMTEIAQKAGYSKRTLYLDYANKDDLFIHVGAGGLEILLEDLRRVPAEGMGIEEYLDAILDVVFAFSHERSEYFRVFFSEAGPDVIANCPEKLRRRVEGLERSILGLLAAQIEIAQQAGLFPQFDAWEASGIFIGSVTGIILLSMAGSQTVFSREKLDSMARQAAWLIWRGMAQGLEAPSREEVRRMSAPTHRSVWMEAVGMDANKKN